MVWTEQRMRKTAREAASYVAAVGMSRHRRNRCAQDEGGEAKGQCQHGGAAFAQ
jgi:hypothetical protein